MSLPLPYIIVIVMGIGLKWWVFSYIWTHVSCQETKSFLIWDTNVLNMIHIHLQQIRGEGCLLFISWHIEASLTQTYDWKVLVSVWSLAVCYTTFEFKKFFFPFLSAYGKVFLVRKNSGHDAGQLYAMKVRSLHLNKRSSRSLSLFIFFMFLKHQCKLS